MSSFGQVLTQLLSFSREQLTEPPSYHSAKESFLSSLGGVQPSATQGVVEGKTVPQAVPEATPERSMASGQHLHYGGMPAKTPYGIGCKPQEGTSFKKQRRHELIARMENASLGEAQIAVLLGISVPRLRSIKQHPDYLAARMKVTLGLIVDQEASLAQIREQRKEFLIQNLPAALQVIANAVHTPAISLADRKLQLFAAQDLLDREGTFAKISRSEVKPVDGFDWASVDSQGSRAVDVVKGTLRVSQSSEVLGDSPSEAKKQIEKIIEITRHFSAGKTPSVFDQQSALDELEREKKA